MKQGSKESEDVRNEGESKKTEEKPYKVKSIKEKGREKLKTCP
jgi:hypothetical protein